MHPAARPGRPQVIVPTSAPGSSSTGSRAPSARRPSSTAAGGRRPRRPLVLELVVPDEVASARLSRLARIRPQRRQPDRWRRGWSLPARGGRPAAGPLCRLVRRVSASGDVDEVFLRPERALASRPRPPPAEPELLVHPGLRRSSRTLAQRPSSLPRRSRTPTGAEAAAPVQGQGWPCSRGGCRPGRSQSRPVGPPTSPSSRARRPPAGRLGATYTLPRPPRIGSRVPRRGRGPPTGDLATHDGHQPVAGQLAGVPGRPAGGGGLKVASPVAMPCSKIALASASGRRSWPRSSARPWANVPHRPSGPAAPSCTRPGAASSGGG